MLLCTVRGVNFSESSCSGFWQPVAPSPIPFPDILIIPLAGLSVGTADDSSADLLHLTPTPQVAVPSLSH